MEEKTFDVDPFTRRELFTAAFKSFNGILQVMQRDYEQYKNMDWITVARTAYVNGFLNGCIAATTDPNFKETVDLMNDEIAYQKAWK